MDNLIRELGPEQITVKGFGFALASGAYANPYFANFLSPPGFLEVFTQGAVAAETQISFSASRLQVPEPSGLALAGLALLALRLNRGLRR